MVDFEYHVPCPLLEQEINMDTCFDIHMAVSGEAPEWTAPDKIYRVADYAKEHGAWVNTRNGWNRSGRRCSPAFMPA